MKHSSVVVLHSSILAAWFNASPTPLADALKASAKLTSLPALTVDGGVTSYRNQKEI